MDCLEKRSKALQRSQGGGGAVVIEAGVGYAEKMGYERVNICSFIRDSHSPLLVLAGTRRSAAGGRR